jgi:hypothetical protein
MAGSFFPSQRLLKHFQLPINAHTLAAWECISFPSPNRRYRAAEHAAGSISLSVMAKVLVGTRNDECHTQGIVPVAVREKDFIFPMRSRKT